MGSVCAWFLLSPFHVLEYQRTHFLLGIGFALNCHCESTVKTRLGKSFVLFSYYSSQLCGIGIQALTKYPRSLDGQRRELPGYQLDRPGIENGKEGSVQCTV